MKSYGKFFFGTYILTYAAIGALFPLVAQYLHGMGFTGVQIGVITASSTAIGIFSNSYIGGIYHKMKGNKNIILFLCLFTALLSLFLMMAKSFWIFLLIYGLVFFFENPVFPLIDSTVVEVDYSFGVARKWGCVGFALGVGLTGIVADKLGLITIFPIFSALFMLTALLVWYFQKGRVPLEEEGEEPAHGHKTGDYKKLLGNGKYMALLFSAFFFVGPALSHNTYFSFLWIEAGGTIAGMGIVLLLMAISEAPFMGWTDKISDILTTERAILIAMSISALRFLWYSTDPPYQAIAGAFLLQGIANGIGIVEFVKYISKLVGNEMISLAIPFFTALSSNCGAITCQLIGGIIVESYGGGGVYMFYGTLNLLGIGIYLLFGLHKPGRRPVSPSPPDLI